MSFQTPITIADAIQDIESNRYLLPAIQREFVWSHHKIEWLFDSLMRNYPVSSFLFWRVEGETVKGYKFYKFLNEYRERYKTHNDEISTDGISSFTAVLDGQQRLTSLYLGLKGSYAYKEPRKKWDNNEWSIPTRNLYLNYQSTLEEQEDGRENEFSFLKASDTSKKDIYDNKWFRVGKILELKNIAKFNAFITENKITPNAINILARLQEVIHSDRLINFFLEKEQNLDKALNIFIRINSGGEPLNFSDLLMSIAVANWEEKDARKEIHSVVDSVRDKGFSISKDLVLKSFLFLYEKDIKFKVTNFSKEKAKNFEKNWEQIRDAILSAFDLLKTFGFNDSTLTSKNAVLPIIYYIYHKGIYQNFSTKIAYESDRKKIEKFLHLVIIKRVFGGQADGVLLQIRKPFTEDFSTKKIEGNILAFPLESINIEIKKNIGISNEFIEELLQTQKDNQYAFSILALLYPNLDYKNNDFHKDHLHPANSYNQNNHKWEIYNSIANLQMLDANENMSKKDQSLKNWINSKTNSATRADFLEKHLIPDVNLSLNNFEEFLEKRKELLSNKLKALLL